MTASNNSRERLGWLTPSQWLFVGLLSLTVIGIAILRHYGEGVDEWQNYTLAWAFVHAYEKFNLLTNPGINYYNGPFFMMVWVVVSQVGHWLIPSWMLVDARHFTTFITFLIGVWLLYHLCLRFMDPRAALFTAALFASQPVLFGHAFLNQKDIPLMTFFLASVVVGWAAVDRIGERTSSRVSSERNVLEEWHESPRLRRMYLLLGMTVGTMLLLDLWVYHVLLETADGVVRNAYSGTSLPLINQAFKRVATDAYKTPLALYVAKVHRAWLWLRLPVSAALFAGMWGLIRSNFPHSLGRKVSDWGHAWGPLVLAAMLVGASTSIRIVGPLAGALIALLMFDRVGRRAILPVIAMGLIAMLMTYLTWPVLWGDPIGQFFGHVLQTSEFTSFIVLYAGRHFKSTELPWHYVPWLLLVQLTLPAGAAILVGVGNSLWRVLKRSGDRVGLIILALWIGIPLSVVMLGWVPVYNNFRHELFILPPLFVLAGVGLELVFRIEFRRFVLAILVALTILPGVLGIVQLHPYEYIYYNSLVGGVDGVADKYELDYWCTAFRRAMTYVDEHATQGADVGVAGAMTSASSFARPDLNLHLDRYGKTTPDVGIACNRGDAANLFPGLKTVFVVRRFSAVLAVVKAPGD